MWFILTKSPAGHHGWHSLTKEVHVECKEPSGPNAIAQGPKVILVVNFRRIRGHWYLQCNGIIPIPHSFSLLSLLCLCFNMQELLFCFIFKALMKPITYFWATIFKAADKKPKWQGRRINAIPLSLCTPLHRNIYMAFQWSFAFKFWHVAKLMIM